MKRPIQFLYQISTLNCTVKVIQAIPGMPSKVTEEEVKKFLESKLNMQLATLDPDGSPIIQPIDEETYPYKGVKGRGEARIIEDIQRNVSIIEKTNLKYLGTQDHPLAKMLLDNARSGVEVVIEISPKFFSAWDFAKAA
jgi:hypothetical protein